MAVNIVIPMKDIRTAKYRLGSALGPCERVALVHRLYRQTLRFFSEYFPDHGLSVVTPDAAVAAIAQAYGAQVIRELEASGLSIAAARAAAWSARQGFPSQLLIPADIARLEPVEIARLLALPRLKPSVIICPAVDHGTNALLTTPPEAIPFCFGHGSSQAHAQAAHQRQVICRTLTLTHLSRDIDWPADLAELSSVIMPRLPA